MDIYIENLSKMVNVERFKKGAAFKLLSELGYTYDYGSGWEKESVFDKPKWVTVNKDLRGFTKDSDYRVLNVLEDDYGRVAEDYQYIVEDDSGKACTIHKGHFYSVTKEDLLPTTSTEDESVVEDVPEWMEGFENLVRSVYDL